MNSLTITLLVVLGIFAMLGGIMAACLYLGIAFHWIMAGAFALTLAVSGTVDIVRACRRK